MRKNPLPQFAKNAVVDLLNRHWRRDRPEQWEERTPRVSMKVHPALPPRNRSFVSNTTHDENPEPSASTLPGLKGAQHPVQNDGVTVIEVRDPP